MHTLAIEQAWSDAYARRVVEEYRRFILIAATSETLVAPSPIVDLAWHAHLLDTEAYFERFCRDVIGRKLHHVPARDDATTSARMEGALERTLARYEALFGSPPPRDIWSGHARDVAADEAGRAFPPQLTTLALVVFAVLLAWASGLFDTSGPTFLLLYVLALISAWAIGSALRQLLEDAYARPSEADLPSDVNALALLAGGPSRVTDTALARLLERGEIGVVYDKIVPRERAHARDAVERAILAHIASPDTPRKLDAAIASALDSSWRELEGRGLAFSRHIAERITWLSAAPACFVLVLGVLKMGVGLSRGRPIGLLFLLVLIAILLVYLVLRERRATPRARVLLDARRTRIGSVREARESSHAGASLTAVALFGLTSAVPAYAALNNARRISGADGDGGGSSCGGGGDGGCGGCGGCGGGD